MVIMGNRVIAMEVLEGLITDKRKLANKGPATDLHFTVLSVFPVDLLLSRRCSSSGNKTAGEKKEEEESSGTMRRENESQSLCGGPRA